MTSPRITIRILNPSLFNDDVYICNVQPGTVLQYYRVITVTHYIQFTSSNFQALTLAIRCRKDLYFKKGHPNGNSTEH